MSDQRAPADNLAGNPLANPAFFSPSAHPRSERVVGVGLDPDSYLRRGILWEVFAPRNVALLGLDELTPGPVTEALVLDSVRDDPVIPWSALLERIGARQAVVDLRTVAAMMQAEGAQIEVEETRGSTDGALAIFRSRLSAPVYPEAPRVRITDSACCAGLAAGDEIHLYGWQDKAPVLAAIRMNDTLKTLLRLHKGVVFGVTDADDGQAALLRFVTPTGGIVTVMDLRTVDRMPEPSGSETPGSHILLSALGATTVTFGKFCCAYAQYDTYVAAVRSLAEQYAAFTRFEQVGLSEAGRPLYMLSVARNRDTPAVLITCGVHPMEWGPIYGILRYVNFLLAECAADTAYARDLLGDRQLCWVLSSCPDGWESRDQQASGININRNYPGTWEKAGLGTARWDSYNRRFNAQPDGEDYVAARGPAPGSAPEAQAQMQLLERPDLRFTALCDFHETTAPKSFLHQPETEDGGIFDQDYHCELVDRVAANYNHRLYAHTNVVAYRPALADFSTWNFRALRSLNRLIPGESAGWIQYASQHGIKSSVVEAAGSDCTHYQTIRRSEFGAVACEQVLAGEAGGLLRNPWNAPLQRVLPLYRKAERLEITCYDTAGHELSREIIDQPDDITLRLPPRSLARWRYL